MDQDDLEKHIRAAITGDRQSLDRVCEFVYKITYSWAYKLTRNPEDVEDIATAVCIRVYQSITTFEFNSIAQFCQWVKNITKHCFIDWLRKKPPINPVELTEAVAVEFPRFDEQADFKVFLISVLTPEEYALIHMRFWQDKKLEEIAADMNVAVSTVYDRLQRIYKKIRKALND